MKDLLPPEPITIRSRFKCGHEEIEVAANHEEAKHLRESAPFFNCIACMVAAIKGKEEPCPPSPPAAPQASATA